MKLPHRRQMLYQNQQKNFHGKGLYRTSGTFEKGLNYDPKKHILSKP